MWAGVVVVFGATLPEWLAIAAVWAALGKALWPGCMAGALGCEVTFFGVTMRETSDAILEWIMVRPPHG
jgi:hypothetical protein